MQSAWILNCDVKQFDVVKAFEYNLTEFGRDVSALLQRLE